MIRFGGTWRMWWHGLSRRTSIRLISPSRTGRLLLVKHIFSKLTEIADKISPGFAFLPPRFMAGSEMLLAANHGNKYSIAIEVNTRLPFLPLPAPIHPRWPVHPLSITICGRSSRRPSPTIGATTGTKDELKYISGQVG